MRAGCARFLVFEKKKKKTRAHEPTTPGFLHSLFTLVRTLLSRGWLVFFSDLHRNRGTAFFSPPRIEADISSVAQRKTCRISFFKKKSCTFVPNRASRCNHREARAAPRFPCCIDGKTAEVPSPCTLTPYTNEDTLNESTTSIIHYI